MYPHHVTYSALPPRANVVCVDRDSYMAPEFEKLTWSGEGLLGKAL